MKVGSLIWILDSGASDHVACSLEYFTELKHVDHVFVSLPNKQTVNVSHIGTVVLTPTLQLHNVLYVLQFSYNIISASKLTTICSCYLLFYNIVCAIQDQHHKTIVQAKVRGGLYYIDLSFNAAHTSAE